MVMTRRLNRIGRSVDAFTKGTGSGPAANEPLGQVKPPRRRLVRQERAKVPYHLRHAAVSLWLNAGVPATQVAECAGHSVHVLLKVYAKCIDGQDEAARKRIEAALNADEA